MRGCALTMLALVACARADGGTQVGRLAITGGTPDDGDPAVVALWRDGALVCTGTVIAPRVVLTAAHCLSSPIDEVVLGAAPDTHVAVLDAVPHPSFDAVALTNDIAVVLLTVPTNIVPAPLPASAEDAPHVGMPLRLVGFGATSTGELGSKNEGTTRIYEVADATFSFHGEPAQTCAGDSGGPAFAVDTGVLVGVTSFGDADCMAFGTDTRVDRYLDDFILPYLVATAPGGAALGERCFYPANCVTGQCVLAADALRLGYCSAACGADGDCAVGMFCNLEAGARCEYPSPAPGAAGWPCTSDADCDRYTCAYELGVCLTPCTPGDDCGAGNNCELISRQDLRFACTVPPQPMPAAGCAVLPVRGGGTGSSVLLAFLLLIAAWHARCTRLARTATSPRKGESKCKW